MFYSLRAVGTVFYRNVLLFKNFWISTMIPDVIDNAFWFVAFAVGVGSMVAMGQGVEYIHFLVPGTMLLTGLYYSANETTYALLPKLSNVWPATLNTPVTISCLMLGDLLWAAARGIISTVSLYVIVVAFGFVENPLFALLVFPVAFLVYLTSCAVGMLVASFIKHEQLFSYYWVFWLSPSLLFSGVYFDLEGLEGLARSFAEFVPTTHGVRVAQDVVLRNEVPLGHLMSFVGISFTIIAICFVWSHHNFKKRLLS